MRRSALRDRSAGATSCSSRPASRPAELRNVRRCRASMPYLREPSARRGDVRVALAVEPLAGFDARCEEAVLLELARERGVDPRAPAELREVELRLLRPEPGRPAPLPLGRAGARRELLADHPQRQELVALQEQDRLEPLHVLLAEEPVAAARALRRQQALILEVADLGDRDVREVGLQARAHRADRVQAWLLLFAAVGGGGRRHRRRKVRRYLPICTSSSSSRSVDSIRFLFTNVPLRLPRSLIVNALVVADELRVAPRDGHVVEEDVALGRAADQRALAGGEEALPRSAAARADDERRPLARQVLQRGRAAVGQRPQACRSSSARPPRPCTGAIRSASSSSPPPDSGTRTPGSRRGSLVLVLPGVAAGGEDVGETLDVDVGRPRALQPRRALCPQDVDPPLEQAAPDTRPRSPRARASRSASLRSSSESVPRSGSASMEPFRRGLVRSVKQQTYRGVNLSLRLLPRFAAPHRLPA